MDDTINIVRKSNLSVDFNKDNSNIDEELDFKQESEERYGKKLLILIENQFER